MNRKDFLATTFTAGLGLALAPMFLSCSTAQVDSITFEPLILKAGNLAKVRGNVNAFTNKGGTVGVFETKEGFIIIDSQFSDSIQPVLEAISTKGKPVLYLCNTHHHGDHTSGNIAFKDLTNKIVAHQRVPELQRKAAEKSNKLNEQLYANILFEKEYKINLGNEKITGYHFGNGHTFGDVVYHFENDNVVHVGDLMFINMIPVYRTSDGADSFNWIKALGKIQEKFDDDTLFIFGHSDNPLTTFGTNEDLIQMREFLSASNDLVFKFQKEGKTVEDLLKAHSTIPGFENRKSAERLPDFIKGIWETLDKV